MNNIQEVIQVIEERNKSSYDEALEKILNSRKKNFIHLHVHSEYSVLDGLVKPDQICAKAVEQGCDSVAITDHGSISSMPDFFKCAKKHNIKPLIGCEFYISEDLSTKKGAKNNHLTVIAKDWSGVQSIMRVLSIGNRQYHRRPRITFDQAMELDNCIVMTACVAGILGRDDWEQRVCDFHDRYKEDFYLEIMPHVVIDKKSNIDLQKVVNSRAIIASSKYGIKLVATCDSHYANRDDRLTHEVLLAIQMNAKWDSPDRFGKGFPDAYMQSYDDMVSAFSKIGIDENISTVALDNTHEVADKCNVVKPDIEIHLPYLNCDQSLPEEEIDRLANQEFKEKILNGWNKKIKGKVDERVYAERLKYEIGVIKDLGFIKYFLIVEDFITYAREHDIPIGPGRGSAAGSLVCWLMGITQVDPIRHDLHFERFLNKDRVSLPDIDVDVCKAKREQVVEYIKDKYGRDNTSQIGTFGRLTCKSAFRDVCRVFGIPPYEVNRLSNLIEDEESFDNVPELAEFIKKNPHIIKHVRGLSGILRQVGVHAAGVVVSNDRIDSVGVLENRKGVEVVCWDKHSCESDFGLLKIDVLGLSTLDVLDMAKKLIKQEHGVDIVFEDIPLDDEKTLEMFSKGETIGIFQMESNNIRKLLNDLHANSFDMVTACTALFRPGPLQSGLTEQYKQIVQGRRSVSYPHKKLVPVLENTLGTILYQEQIMSTCTVLAGFSGTEADEVRKVMGKKQIDKIPYYREKFIKGCLNNNVEEHIAVDLFDKMAEFAKYSFNHCFSGDCKINRLSNNKGSYTIREMYKIKNDEEYARRTGHIHLHFKYKHKGYGFALSDCGDAIKKNKIVDIRFEGCRDVYRILTESGKYVDVTSNHKMPTKNGIKTIDSGLCVGDVVYVKGGRVKKEYNYNLTCGEKIRGVGSHYNGMGFKSGKENVGHVNGEYSKFKENRAKRLELSRGLCEKCGQMCDRLECHHVDFSRKNNEFDNLIVLCPSCHKKEHYAHGRVRKGENGYEKVEERIVSIECIGEIDVYDVEMDDPHHTVVVNDILACNSHAVAYTMITFWSAYLKAHYGKEYMTALMSCTTKTDNLPRYIREVDRMGFEVSMPDINRSEDRFCIKDGKIVIPFSSIKGIGDRAVECIIDARRGGAFDSFEDFQSRVYKRVVSKRVVETLKKVGALESIGVYPESEEQKQKDMTELISVYNRIPSLSLEGNIDHDGLVELYSRIECCSKEHHKELYKPVFGKKASIMVINNPMRGEKNNLSAGHTRYLIDGIKSVGLRKCNVYYTNPVKCRFDRKACKFCANKCHEFLKEEIILVKPAVIIVCDFSIAHMFVTGKPKKQDVLNNLIFCPEFDSYVLFSHSPQYVSFKNDQKLVDDFSKTMDIIGQIFS